MDFVWFMLFSMIEGMTFFSLTLAIYRLKFTNYLGPLLILNVLVNGFSFYLRKEADLADIAPFVTLFFLILFLMAVLRIPAFWSMIVAATGYVAFTLLQAGIMLLSFGYLSLQEVNSHEWKGFLVQILTGIIGYAVATWIYRRGIGFSFEFVKLRWFTVVLAPLFILIAIAACAVFIFKNLFIISGILIISLLILLYYALRRDKSDESLGL